MTEPLTSRASLVANGTIRLKRELATTGNPAVTIKGFRAAHELQPQRCHNYLELLSLLGQSRGDSYRGLLEALVKRLETGMQLMTPQAQEQLLLRSFCFINNSEPLRSIPVALLKKIRVIPARFLHELALNPALHDTVAKLPVPVQQMVWETDAGLEMFEVRISPLLEAYRTSLGQRLLSNARFSVLSPAKVPADRWRAQNKALPALLEAIGSRPKLLDATCRLVISRLGAIAGTPEAGVWPALLVDLFLTYELVLDRSKRPPNLDRRLRVAKVLDQAVRSADTHASFVPELLKALRAVLPAVATNPVVSGVVSGGVRVVPEVSALRPLLEGAWAKLTELDTERVFAHAVTDDVAPKYKEIVKKPMDLSLIRNKMGKVRGGYESLEVFNKDVELMITNCWKFNTKVSFFGCYATKVYEAWKQQLAILRARVKELRNQSAALHTSTSASGASGGATETISATGVLLPLTPQQAGSHPEVVSSLSMLGHPTVALLLAHAISLSLDRSCKQPPRALPSDQRLVPAALQLLHIGQCGPTRAATTTPSFEFSVPASDAVSLRRFLPLVQRLMGELSLASSSSSSTSDTAEDSPLWPQVLAKPVLRQIVIASVGGALYRTQTKAAGRTAVQTPGDGARAASLFRVLGRHGGAHVASEQPFLDALVATGSKPHLPFQHASVRQAALECVASLAASSPDMSSSQGAREVAIKLLLGWSAMSDKQSTAAVKSSSSLPASQNSTAGTSSSSSLASSSSSSSSSSAWVSEADVRRTLKILGSRKRANEDGGGALAGEDESGSGQAAMKRACLGESAGHTADYSKLQEAFPSIDFLEELDTPEETKHETKDRSGT